MKKKKRNVVGLMPRIFLNCVYNCQFRPRLLLMTQAWKQNWFYETIFFFFLI